MSVWILIQVVCNLFLLAGLALCLVKIFKPQEDDPRLNQGLRLLQSKIAILEDLSDHTENQVKQLMALLDKKLHEVRGTMTHINQQIHEVDQSIAQSKQMAQMIQNEIQPDHIVEKKIENRYIQAAQMAHAGETVEAIVKALGLPKAEVDLIVKINKKNCVYDKPVMKSSQKIQDELFSRSFEMPDLISPSLDQTQMNFHQAVQDHREKSGFQAIKLG